MLSKIKKGDVVFVLAGKDKGKTGVVKAMLNTVSKIGVKNKKAIVSGINLVKCFNKKKNPGIDQKEMPLHISNLAHVDPQSGLPTKIKIVIENNEKFLVAKKSGAKIRKVGVKNA